MLPRQLQPAGVCKHVTLGFTRLCTYVIHVIVARQRPAYRLTHLSQA